MFVYINLRCCFQTMRPVSISDFKTAVAFSDGSSALFGSEADGHAVPVQHYDSCSDSDDDAGDDQVFSKS